MNTKWKQPYINCLTDNIHECTTCRYHWRLIGSTESLLLLRICTFHLKVCNPHNNSNIFHFIYHIHCKDCSLINISLSIYCCSSPMSMQCISHSRILYNKYYSMPLIILFLFYILYWQVHNPTSIRDILLTGLISYSSVAATCRFLQLLYIRHSILNILFYLLKICYKIYLLFI